MGNEGGELFEEGHGDRKPPNGALSPLQRVDYTMVFRSSSFCQNGAVKLPGLNRISILNIVSRAVVTSNSPAQCLRSSGRFLDRFHACVGQPEMVADLVHQHMR